MTDSRKYPIRTCAQEVIAAIEAHPDVQSAIEAFMPSVRRLAERPDLLTLGVKGEPIHMASRMYLYMDDGMTMLLSRMKNGIALPVHDHGWGWEVALVYRGELQQKVYERVDDGSSPGHAELKLIEDEIMTEGQYARMVPPHAEIHTLVSRSEDTYLLGLIGGSPSGVRRYYQPERGTYLDKPAGFS